ncbi:hypothetical protein KR093_007208 [Drosophila rubida]|uniref:Proton-coupled folate transporter n=1 Tax=Drosophila rubida TaxID=30044 RepID=A0AAD4PI69_9MUSC|nr:hypothetical protein KR093_007208 [Drosophila rubida]
MVDKTFISGGVEHLKNLPWQKIFYMFYIEPIVFTLIFSHMLTGTVMRNEIIYQTCKVIFHYNETDCKRLDDKEAGPEIHAIETEIQAYVADMFLTRMLIESIVPAICGLFSGSWSDHYGRKPLLIASMIGFSGSGIISTVICALSRSYEINPWWYTIAAIPHSFLGGMCVFTVAAMCFITDITDMQSRPYRMIFIEMLIFVALSSGSLLSSYVYEATNAAVTQGISASLVTMVTVYIVCCLPESLHIRQEIEAREAELKNISIECSNKQANDEKQEKTKSELNVTNEKKPIDSDESNPKAEKLEAETEAKKAGLFSLTHLKEMIITCWKPREHNARGIIWLVTLAMFMTMFVVDGVMTVMYLFVRQKFHWSIREYTFFETVSQLVPMVGAMLGIVILRKLFGLSVVMLALLSLSSEILGNLAKGFAHLPWHMYLSIALGIFRSIGGPMCRTIVSNIVPASDLGKIYSIKNVLQSFAPFVAGPLYTFIYQQTLSFCPGLFNFVSAALFLVAFVAIG